MPKVKQFKPMLAATLDDLSTVSYPVLASPKLDGIRCVIRNGKALTRSLKPVPNKAIRTHLEGLADTLEGCDGELMIDDVTFQEITSNVMSPNLQPHAEWYFAVFDWFRDAPDRGFETRLENAEFVVSKANNPHVVFVEHREVNSERELLDFEHDLVAVEGFEGVMLRDPDGLYKFGRSTVREGGLLKLKRFSDDEATIVGAVELQHNDNEAFTGELGQTKRSTAKAGKRGGATLGALVVEHPTFGRFELGTFNGLTADQKREMWQQHLDEQLVGKLAKFKYFAVGVKDKPRHPVFLGLRSQLDL